MVIMQEIFNKMKLIPLYATLDGLQHEKLININKAKIHTVKTLIISKEKEFSDFLKTNKIKK